MVTILHSVPRNVDENWEILLIPVEKSYLNPLAKPPQRRLQPEPIGGGAGSYISDGVRNSAIASG